MRVIFSVYSRNWHYFAILFVEIMSFLCKLFHFMFEFLVFFAIIITLLSLYGSIAHERVFTLVCVVEEFFHKANLVALAHYHAPFFQHGNSLSVYLVAAMVVVFYAFSKR